MIPPLIITKAARETAQRAGLYGNLDERLSRMVARSAAITHTLGNRRFEQFVMLVEDGKLHAVNRISDGHTIPSRRRGRENSPQLEHDTTGEAVIIEDRRKDKYGNPLFKR